MRLAGGAAALRGSLARLIRYAIEFSLPARCAMCAAPAHERGPLCADCFAAIPRWSTPLCTRCLLCGIEPVGCRHHRGHAAHTAWLYEERAAAVIHSIKFSGFQRLSAGLAPEVLRVLPANASWDLIATVPLHPLRRRERGYNQVEPLARALSTALGVPLVDGLLERIRHTPPQTGLHGSARRRNLEGAFRVRTPSWLRGRNVLILDDVITTGATMAAAMDSVRRAGGRPVGAALAWAQ